MAKSAYTGMRPWQNWAIFLSSAGIFIAWYGWGYDPKVIEKV
jgi:hypothetical protein